jgi:hypothetical protein
MTEKKIFGLALFCVSLLIVSILQEITYDKKLEAVESRLALLETDSKVVQALAFGGLGECTFTQLRHKGWHAQTKDNDQ